MLNQIDKPALTLHLKTGINQCKLEMAKSKNTGKALLEGRGFAFRDLLIFRDCDCLEAYIKGGIYDAERGIRDTNSTSLERSYCMGRKLAFEETLKFIKENGK